LSANELTTVFVTTIGAKENFEDCMQHLRQQTVERRVEVIDHVAPMSAAFQRMLDQCRTPLYIQVDEDMILFPHAIETLERLISQSPAETAMVCAPLWDCDIEQPIEGIKIYRHEIVKRFPYHNTLSCEVEQLARFAAGGFTIDRRPLRNGSGSWIDRSACLGEHGKHYTPETIFKRWQRLFQKQRQVGNLDFIEPWPEKLLDRYVKTRDNVHLYAWLGAITGITGELLPNREADYREPNPAFAALQRYFPVD
jgi:hypothetical protein